MSSSPEQNQSKNRNFICSCGKAYLSYAALFTHIKQKHGGKAPGQIVRPRSQNKRGRPRKNDKISTQKSSKNFGNNGILDNNNFKNNIKLVNQFNLELQNSGAFSRDGKGFTSYRGENHSNNRKGLAPVQKGFSIPKDNIYFPTGEEQQNFQLTHGNCEFSSNTLAFAQVVSGLQQALKDINDPMQITQEKLSKFQSYSELKNYHSQIVKEKQIQGCPKQAFRLGNIICAFLNLCKQTVESKAAFQQVMLLMVCLIEHIKVKQGKDVLRQVINGSIHQLLSSYLQQYHQKVIKGSQFQKHWIFQSNNEFKVIISFLGWLSVVQKGDLKRKKQNQKITTNNEQYSGEQDELISSSNVNQSAQNEQFQQAQDSENIEPEGQLQDQECKQILLQDEQQKNKIQIKERLPNQVK